MPWTKAGVTYNAAALDAAIVGVHTGMSIHKASAIFGVLRTMLQDMIKGKIPLEMRKGSKPYLTEGIEEKIKDWLLQMAWIIYGQTWRDVINKVQELVTKLNIPNPFPEGKSTKKWYRLFMKHFEGMNGPRFESWTSRSILWQYNLLVSGFTGIYAEKWIQTDSWWP